MKNSKKEKCRVKMFKEDQGNFYRILRKNQVSMANIPWKEQCERFWKIIFENKIQHNNQTRWIGDLKNSPEITNIAGLRSQ